MIRLSIFIETQKEKKFDKECYLNTHMPLSVKLQGDAVKAVDRIIQQYVHFLYDSFKAFQAAFMPHAETLMKDILNYTDVETVIQFSEVKIRS